MIEKQDMQWRLESIDDNRKLTTLSTQTSTLECKACISNHLNTPPSHTKITPCASHTSTRQSAETVRDRALMDTSVSSGAGAEPLVNDSDAGDVRDEGDIPNAVEIFVGVAHRLDLAVTRKDGLWLFEVRLTSGDAKEWEVLGRPLSSTGTRDNRCRCNSPLFTPFHVMTRSPLMHLMDEVNVGCGNCTGRKAKNGGARVYRVCVVVATPGNTVSPRHSISRPVLNENIARAGEGMYSDVMSPEVE